MQLFDIIFFSFLYLSVIAFYIDVLFNLLNYIIKFIKFLKKKLEELKND